MADVALNAARSKGANYADVRIGSYLNQAIITRKNQVQNTTNTDKFSVKNFRFNESPVIMLNNPKALGVPERVGNMMIPRMKIRDFTFSSLSDAV